ncbi:MAG: hypothetical protein ACKO2K_20855 [Alphaproteobacteria bacterium]
MPSSLRRVTIPEALEVALDLERRTMDLYAAFVREFADVDELRGFWLAMARGEAAHYGALMLVETIVRNDPALSGEAKILFDTSTGVRLRSLLTAYRRETKRGIDSHRAFEMAVDLESSELEDVVVDLLQVVSDPSWREQAVKMLIHDIGDLSYMIETHTKDAHLLARADALLERRLGRTMPGAGTAGAPRRTRSSKSA